MQAWRSSGLSLASYIYRLLLSRLPLQGYIGLHEAQRSHSIAIVGVVARRNGRGGEGRGEGSKAVSPGTHVEGRKSDETSTNGGWSADRGGFFFNKPRGAFVLSNDRSPARPILI